jgi:halimadienyl-diphosphate synthase
VRQQHATDGLSLPRSIASTAYDTAWIASLPDPGDRRRPRFPASFAWMLDHQHPDGSWGGSLPYQHDRLISTLAACLALTRFRDLGAADEALRRAQSYLWRHAHLLRSEPIELVGFELLLPALAQEVAQAGVSLPGYLDAYAEQRARKLALIPADMMYSARVTVSHSIEFLGPAVDTGRLLANQSANGSIGNSPAATAFLLQRVENAAALQYLHACMADNGASAPVLHPCETYDQIWSAYHRLLGGASPAGLLGHADLLRLREAIESGEGVSLSPSFPIPDADDTAVTIVLLNALGIRPSFGALEQFATSECYASFPYERHPSTGVNIHVLDAIKLMPPSPARDAKIGRIIDFLTESRLHRTFWIDKWHISPYYATAHALIAFEGLQLAPPYAGHLHELVETALEWIRQTQRPDGSWGYYEQATAEETAFALLAASRWQRRMSLADRGMLQRGLRALRAMRSIDCPPLWIDKCLYLPMNIVDAVLDAALQAARAHTTDLQLMPEAVTV